MTRNGQGDSRQGDSRQEDRRRDPELRASFERILVLRSAWGVLSPSALGAAGQRIAETGRRLSDELKAVAGLDMTGRDKSVLPRLDSLVDSFAAEMRAVACGLSVSEFRSTIKGGGGADRRGSLNLLDLLLGDPAQELDTAALDIASIDFLITHLCDGGSGDAKAEAAPDPVELTPKIHSFCQQADAVGHPEATALETEFLAAAAALDANANANEDVGDSLGEGSPLWRRKLELGASYFVPSLFRAIALYNSAVFRQLNFSQSPVELPAQSEQTQEAEGADNADSAVSVFATPALSPIIEALRRRMSGGLPTFAALDRVSSSLDLAYLNGAEQAALLSPPGPRDDEVKRTVILVGLLCRAAGELEAELPLIGIAPERLSSEWIRELDDALKEQIQEKIAGDAYPEACVLSELKSKFLYKSILDLNSQKQRPVVAAEAVSDPLRDERVSEQAGQLVEQAIDEKTADPGARSRVPPARGWRPQPAQVALFVVTIAALGALVVAALPASDLAGFSRAELDGVSPHLASGGRNDEGIGSAFVGKLADGWSDLAAPEREKAAAELVARLRAQGLRDIMLYDDQRRLRVQALGDRPARIVAANP